eukprot:1455632-Alexandrium_andersonii.AAC.1
MWLLASEGLELLGCLWACPRRSSGFVGISDVPGETEKLRDASGSIREATAAAADALAWGAHAAAAAAPAPAAFRGAVRP